MTTQTAGAFNSTGNSPSVLTEPLTYQPGAQASYFRDLTLAEAGDTAASARLSAHAA